MGVPESLIPLLDRFGAARLDLPPKTYLRPLNHAQHSYKTMLYLEEVMLTSRSSSSTTVYSFVAESEATDFSGDILNFFKYLESNEGFSSSQYLVSIGAGTEPFTGMLIQGQVVWVGLRADL